MQPVVASTGQRPILPALLILLLGIALHLQLAMRPEGLVATGRLLDTDPYVRTMRVERLHETGRWFDTDLPQLNAPDGLSIHWTRPLDVLILLPALAADRLTGMGMRGAIFWVGALLSPLLHILAALAAAWAARALWPGTEAWFAAVALLANPVLSGLYAAPGHTDHHTLILLSAVLGLGGALRAVGDPGDRASAWAAGTAFGVGVWVSPETLTVAGPVLAALGGVWWLRERGGPVARQGLRMALALLAVLAAALVLEQPPGHWLDGDYDKISAQHVLMALLASAGFGILAASPEGLGRVRRLALGILLAGLALAVLLSLYPQALLSSKASAGDGAADLFLPYVAEMQPLAFTPAGLRDLLLWAGGLVGLLAIPVLLREGRWPAALVLGAAMAATLAATLAHRRFAVDLAATTGVAGAGLVWFALHRLRRPAGLRPLALAGAILLACGTPWLGFALPAPPTSQIDTSSCDWHGLAAWLAGAEVGPDMAGRPVVLTDTPNFTPDLAYHTPYRFIAAPYHRSGAAFRDTFDAMTARDDAAARAILARRQVGLVLLCLAVRPANLGPLQPDSLEARLRGGRGPDWLQPVALPAGLDGMFRLFRVQATTGG